MVKPDLIVVWPKHTDYPPFRQWIHNNKDLFEKIIIAFTDIASEWDFRTEITLDLVGECVLFDANCFGDWRDAATKQALLHAQSGWVLFMEQDFFISRNKLIEVLSEDTQYGFKQEDRIHPGFLLLKRSRLELTSKNFAANPPHYDHFGGITKQLNNIAFLDNKDYLHLNGLSHNFSLCTRSETQYIYGREAFINYLFESTHYPCSEKYLALVNLCLEALNENIR